MRIEFTHTTEPLELQILFNSAIVAVFRSTGGEENVIDLMRHACAVPMCALYYVDVNICIPNLRSTQQQQSINLLYVFLTNRSRHIQVSQPFVSRLGYFHSGMCATTNAFEMNLPFYLKQLRENNNNVETPDLVWRANIPWSVKDITTMALAWKGTMGRPLWDTPLVGLLRCIPRKTLADAHICPLLMDCCELFDCTACLGIQKILMSNLPTFGTLEWNGALWPFIGGVRECDVRPKPRPCCEFIRGHQSTYLLNRFN